MSERDDVDQGPGPAELAAQLAEQVRAIFPPGSLREVEPLVTLDPVRSWREAQA
ncbi:MAG: hypothetical protein R3C15_09575 [Thermoleophilia bacterium]